MKLFIDPKFKIIVNHKKKSLLQNINDFYPKKYRNYYMSFGKLFRELIWHEQFCLGLTNFNLFRRKV